MSWNKKIQLKKFSLKEYDGNKIEQDKEFLRLFKENKEGI